MARSAAIFGMTGSTARENSVDAKITRLTTRRMGEMGLLSLFGQRVECHQALKKRRQLFERNHVWPIGRGFIGILVSLDEHAGNTDSHRGTRQHWDEFAFAARRGAVPA